MGGRKQSKRKSKRNLGVEKILKGTIIFKWLDERWGGDIEVNRVKTEDETIHKTAYSRFKEFRTIL